MKQTKNKNKVSRVNKMTKIKITYVNCLKLYKQISQNLGLQYPLKYMDNLIKKVYNLIKVKKIEDEHNRRTADGDHSERAHVRR